MFYQSAFGLSKFRSYLAAQYSWENTSQVIIDKSVSGAFKLECAFFSTMGLPTCALNFLQLPCREVGAHTVRLREAVFTSEKQKSCFSGWFIGEESHRNYQQEELHDEISRFIKLKFGNFCCIILLKAGGLIFCCLNDSWNGGGGNGH